MRHWRTRLLAVALGLLLAVGLAGPAQGAPVRDDSVSRPIYFVPGYGMWGGYDCWSDYWKPAGDQMRAWGMTGSYHTVGYYDGNTNCNTTIINGGSRDVSIKELGRLLAWNIYSSYSKHNLSVDVVAHSMGGLVTRAALTGVARKESGWPPYLYIEDVVTLSTPHRGTGIGYVCAFIQCQEMRPGSTLLNWLYQSPQSAIGTDWTLMGADDDDTVDTESALGMSAGHYVRYDASQGIEHDQIYRTLANTSYNQRYWNYYDKTWVQTGAGASPVRALTNALYHWWRW
ncbi:esterase/lipase family protein [Streptomyces sp. NPDC002888]|uniref:esterase/lipase family protein n=1 Tax=Streptomyces sp. NPDC002888 TaxID=3364668 RepID=UPI0036B340D1